MKDTTKHHFNHLKSGDPKKGALKQTGKTFRLTLFWKIFAWFWLTIIVLITLFLFIGYINSDKIHFRPLPPPVIQELQHTTKRVTEITKRRGGKFDKPFRHLREVLLLNENGQELFSRPVPELLTALHTRVKRHQQPQSAFRRHEAFIGGTRIDIQGEDYWLYRQQRARMFSANLVRSFFRDIATVLLLGVFVISFPVSFALSWLITRPIRQFQLATREMQADLSNRDNLKKLNQRSDEFGELANDFDHMANHLSTLIASQKQLLSDVSHELRSPLTRLQIALGMAEKIAMEKAVEQTSPERSDASLSDTSLPDTSLPDASQQASHIARIKLESQRMNQMLDNLLALSQLEAQEINAAKEPCDLCQIIKAVIEDGRFEAEQSNIRISQNVPDSCEIQGVKEALISGIENILRNAIRYAGENGEILVNLEQKQGLLALSIRDSGPGVAENQLDKLFDAFYRPEFDRARDSGGVGLGLSIAKRAFRLNGGEISARNAEPHGLKVVVKFNL